MRNSAPTSTTPTPSGSSTSSTLALPLSVTLTIFVYQRLLAVCPSELRHAYGAQMTQVFKQYCRDAYAERGASGVFLLWLPTLGDLFTCAAAEYVTLVAQAWKANWFMHRARTSAITVFCAYIVFILAGMGFQKLTEYDDFMAAARTHTTIGVAYNVVVGGAALALLAMLAGGLPLAVAACRDAIARRRADILVLMSVPVLVLLLLIAYIIVCGHLLADMANTPNSSANAAFFFGLLAILIGGAIASAVAVSLAITRSEIAVALYRFSRVPAAVAAAAMVAMSIATVVWGIGLRAATPQLFNSNEGIRASSTSATWIAIVVMMAVAALIALVGAVRGFSSRQLASAGA